MKRIILMLAAVLPLIAFAQSLTVTRSLEMLPNSQAVVQFNNIFGNWENREVDDSFPYVVIQMNLTGDANAVSMAKQKIGLEVGTMYQVTATDKNQPNKILFLVPRGVRNIYVVCGDGCEKQLLHSGTLIENKVYECTVEYAAASENKTVENSDAILAQMAAMQKQIEELQKQNQQNGGNAAGANKGQKQVEQTPEDDSGEKLQIEVNGVKFNMIKVPMTNLTYIFCGDTIKDDYYIGETEVTQALWIAVMGNNPSYWKGDDLPVEQVSYVDCLEFIDKLNELTGRKFRLPSHSLWICAAEGGSKSRKYAGSGYKYAGSNNINRVAWYKGNSFGMTHPVGQKQANELGIYDMSGNVTELCISPVGSGNYEGGNWSDKSRRCKGLNGFGASPFLYNNGSNKVGLRLVMLP